MIYVGGAASAPRLLTAKASQNTLQRLLIKHESTKQAQLSSSLSTDGCFQGESLLFKNVINFFYKMNNTR